MPSRLKERKGLHRFLHSVWYSETNTEELLVIPAKSTWDIIVIANSCHTQVQLSAPYKHPQRIRVGGSDGTSVFIGLRFTTGVYLPNEIQLAMQGRNTVDLATANDRFTLGKETLAIPTYDNAEFITDTAMKKGLLLIDRTIDSALGAAEAIAPTRTIQRRFLRRTDMSKAQANQLRRAEYVASLLHQGMTLAEAAAIAGYADQAHMTRTFKTLYGTTPRTFYKDYIDSN